MNCWTTGSKLATLAALAAMALAGNQADGAVVTIARTITDYDVVRGYRYDCAYDEIREAVPSPSLPPISAGDVVKVDIDFAAPVQIIPDEISSLMLWVSVGDPVKITPQPPGDSTLGLGGVDNLQAGPFAALLDYGLDGSGLTRRMTPYYVTDDLSKLFVDPTSPGTLGEIMVEFVVPATAPADYVFSRLEVCINARASDMVAGPMLRAVPEPSTLAIWSLLGALGISVGWWRRRRGMA